MRSYIFTPLERRLVQRFLKEDASMVETNTRKLLYRVKTFKTLAADVDLFLQLRKRLAESQTTHSA